jgi:hypothetical protein
LTYPQIAGIGVTAGENADNHLEGEYSIENFLFNTYGRGVIDVREQQPDREVRFIFRQHMSGLGPITEAFAHYPGEFNTSFKYAIGHMYSMRKPLLFDRRFRREVEAFNVPCWLNLRNDDLFVLRWGSPDFVREYIQQMPHDVLAGFYMGSDGYVWGREFIAKNSEMAGRLEIDKHWYRFRQWGQLAYNPELDRDYWEAVLEHRFPGVDARLLYGAWAASSEIVPQVNSACYGPNDAHISPEGCIAREGFLTVDHYFFDPDWYGPMEGSGIHSAREWGKAVVAGEELKGLTPLQVAENLDASAATALAPLPTLRTQVGDNVELQETLNDIESTAYLGRYYADKMRGAAKLAAFRESQTRQFSDEAVTHLRDAVQEWKAYAAIVSSQYKPQLMARTHVMDWNRILAQVEQEVAAAEREGDYPNVRFTNLRDGARCPAQTDLRVEAAATDRDGIREMKLYLNGLLLKAHATEPHVWSGSSDELLRSLRPGVYRLEAVAEDNTGSFGRQAIQVAVGDVPTDDAKPRSDVTYQVILEEDQRLTDGEVREFPRLECDLGINEDGRLVLHGVIPGKSRDRELLWKASMYKSHGSHYATLEKGQLVIYRGTPDRPGAAPFRTPPVSGPGPYKLGITVSRKLVIVREVEGQESEIVWEGD